MKFRSIILLIVGLFTTMSLFVFRCTYQSNLLREEARQKVLSSDQPLTLETLQKTLYDLTHTIDSSNRQGGLKPKKYYVLPFVELTYQELVRYSLIFGVDLKGGVSYQLEQDVVAILKTLTTSQSDSQKIFERIKQLWDQAYQEKIAVDPGYQFNEEALVDFFLMHVYDEHEATHGKNASARLLFDIPSGLEPAPYLKKEVRRLKKAHLKIFYEKVSYARGECHTGLGSSEIYATFSSDVPPEAIREALETNEFKIRVKLNQPLDTLLDKSALRTIKKNTTTVKQNPQVKAYFKTNSNYLSDEEEDSQKLERLEVYAVDLSAARELLQKLGTKDITKELALQETKTIGDLKVFDVVVLGEPILRQKDIKHISTATNSAKGYSVELFLTKKGQDNHKRFLREVPGKYNQTYLVVERGQLILSSNRRRPLNIKGQDLEAELIKAGSLYVDAPKETELRELLRKLNQSGGHVDVRGVEFIESTLDQEAQKKGFVTILLSLLLVILFMLAYYAFGGLLAIISLFMNLLIMLGVLAQLRTGLTLPGIMGIALTLGMAVDATVLFFERVREEMLRGIPLSKAIPLAYQKATPSIFDGNITTLIIGFVLMAVGKGTYYSFAENLTVGILCSVFTAFLVTRLLIDVFDKLFGLHHLHFTYGWNRELLRHTTIDFIQKRGITYAFSLAVIGGFLGWSYVNKQGIRLGIEFTSGKMQTYTYKRAEGALPMKVFKERLKAEFPREQFAITNKKVDETTYSMQVLFSEGRKRESVDQLFFEVYEASGIKQLNKPTTKTTKEQGDAWVAKQKKVDARMTNETRKSGFLGLLLALLLIFLYILARFSRWQFGLASLIAIIHDCLVLFAIFVGLGYELNIYFLLALLTVIGYSINDSIVVFDRIREIIGQERLPYDQLRAAFNRAINQTLTRTLITSITTLLSILVVVVWGPAELHHFGLALFIGLAVGTYSSIFIAAPLSLDFMRPVSSAAKQVKKNEAP